METAVFALFIIAGGSWIAAIYNGLEDKPYNAVMYGFWMLIAILGLAVLLEQWIEGREVIAMSGAIIGIGVTVLLYEPDLENQQPA